MKRPNIKPEMLVAIIAVFISMSTLFVYIYQSSLMEKQQKMSVWPYIIFGPSWGNDYLYIKLTNKGIGPALVKGVKFEVEGKEVEGIEGIISILPDSLKSEYSYSSVWAGQVVMAGESIEILHITSPKTISYLLNLVKEEKVNIEICYTSVYGDSWTSYGLHVEEGKCK